MHSFFYLSNLKSSKSLLKNVNKLDILQKYFSDEIILSSSSPKDQSTIKRTNVISDGSSLMDQKQRIILTQSWTNSSKENRKKINITTIKNITRKRPPFDSRNVFMKTLKGDDWEPPENKSPHIPKLTRPYDKQSFTSEENPNAEELPVPKDERKRCIRIDQTSYYRNALRNKPKINGTADSAKIEKPKDGGVDKSSKSDVSFQVDTEYYTLSRIKEIETSKGKVVLNLSEDEFDLKEFSNELKECVSKPLDVCKDDLSDLHPNFGPTFNFAAHAEKSPVIQELVKLGVELYQLEKDDRYMRSIYSLTLDKMKPYIQFLHDCGVHADNLGKAITENPLIFQEDLDDLKTRIRYLRAHEFSVSQIATIVTKNPKWLNWATKLIDERLGHFQHEFKLAAIDVRYLACKMPKLITHQMRQIHENTFCIREEFKFEKLETKILLLTVPRLWMTQRSLMVNTYDYLNDTMEIPRNLIIQQGSVLACRKKRIKSRHEFLVELKRNQYDPEKPNYISLMALIGAPDEEFCRDIAKTSMETYNLFLKTQ